MCDYRAIAGVLTEPMRYGKDSELYKIEATARANPRVLRFAISDEVSIVRTPQTLIDDYVDHYHRDSDASHRLLLFRRNDVANANRAIRTRLYGEDAEEVCPDEKLMVLATTDYPYVKERVSFSADRFYSGEKLCVTDAKRDIYYIEIGCVEYEIPHWMIDFVNSQDERYQARIIFGLSENAADRSGLGGEQWSDAVKAAAQYAKQCYEDTGFTDWTLYTQLQMDFVRVGYQYATTVHRAQGQTVDYAYVVPNTLSKIPGLMGAGLTYVALTRARKHLTVLI